MSPDPQVIFWHRNLPPIDAEIMGEHTVEARSAAVTGDLVRGDDLWDRCYSDLMAQTESRLQQEVKRLSGDYAHVLDESIDVGHDAACGQRWLHGRFTYVLYRRPFRPGKKAVPILQGPARSS